MIIPCNILRNVTKDQACFVWDAAAKANNTCRNEHLSKSFEGPPIHIVSRCWTWTIRTPRRSNDDDDNPLLVWSCRPIQGLQKVEVKISAADLEFSAVADPDRVSSWAANNVTGPLGNVIRWESLPSDAPAQEAPLQRLVGSVKQVMTQMEMPSSLPNPALPDPKLRKSPRRLLNAIYLFLVIIYTFDSLLGGTDKKRR